MTSIISTSDKHYLHSNVLLRHATGRSGGDEADIETILAEAAAGARRILGERSAVRRPEAVGLRARPVRDALRLHPLPAVDRDFRDAWPNAMMRAARLRDIGWRRPEGTRHPDEEPRFLSLRDAIELASALSVKETAGVPDLEFLAFDDIGPDGAEPGKRFSLLRLQDYAEDAPVDADVLAAVRLPRAEPVLRARRRRFRRPWGSRFRERSPSAPPACASSRLRRRERRVDGGLEDDVDREFRAPDAEVPIIDGEQILR